MVELSNCVLESLRKNDQFNVGSKRLAKLQLLFLLLGSCLFAAPMHSQITQEETLGGPDSHETGQGRTAICSDSGTAKDRGWRSEVSGSISNT